MGKNINFFDLPPEKKQHTSNSSKNSPPSSNRKIIIIGIVFLLLGLSVFLVSLIFLKPNPLDSVLNSVLRPHSEPIVISSEISQPTPKPTPTPTPTPPKAVIPKEEWFMKIANKNNPISEDFDVNTEKLGAKSYYLDERIVQEYNELMQAAREADIGIRIDSGFRSVKTQTRLFKEEVDKNLYTMEQEEAEVSAEKTVGRPYQSEHQLGLAVDLVPTDNEDKDENFDKTDESKWLTENAWKYGFILRYPKNKEDITGVVYKPWHYRYVGKEQATILNENGMCLEEYLAN